MIYRHGDVILRGIENVEVKRLEKGRRTLVLAEGEETGHQHILWATEGGSLAFLRRNIAVLGGPATLTHQEHKTLTVEVGTYEILSEREYDYAEREETLLAD